MLPQADGPYKNVYYPLGPGSVYLVIKIYPYLDN